MSLVQKTEVPAETPVGVLQFLAKSLQGCKAHRLFGSYGPIYWQPRGKQAPENDQCSLQKKVGRDVVGPCEREILCEDLD